jgi:hypothetical protein
MLFSKNLSSGLLEFTRDSYRSFEGKPDLRILAERRFESGERFMPLARPHVREDEPFVKSHGESLLGTEAGLPQVLHLLQGSFILLAFNESPSGAESASESLVGMSGKWQHRQEPSYPCCNQETQWGPPVRRPDARSLDKDTWRRGLDPAW